MEMKKYVDIERAKESNMAAFTEGEHITVTEKCDGANASLRYADGKVLAFSRRQQLSPDNDLRGFYGFIQRLDPVQVEKVLGSRYILFGEWLVRHSVGYPEDRLNQFYVFDAWDTETERYMPWDFTKSCAAALNLKKVPLFYDGPFTSWDEICKLVGKTEMGATPSGEGIVIKSQDRLDNKSSRTPAYVKIVAEQFSEVQKSKKHEVDPEKLKARQAAEVLAATIVTERRVMKILEKAIDEGRLKEDWDEKDLGVIAKFLPKEMFADCQKEEAETVSQIEDFGKICGGLSMKIARGLIR